ncbi:uncharacterized protein IL334_004151 [Kwoniella shivajii]|uniref:Uncharacterized protein n=1 Tax=Kwoniella shivajii TaxID=564305 RepID=A0ABZ1CZY0_9TREE|nr:hypothetical protein IL334_004151 [Kwoniella shivajii]
MNAYYGPHGSAFPPPPSSGTFGSLGDTLRSWKRSAGGALGSLFGAKQSASPWGSPMPSSVTNPSFSGSGTAATTPTWNSGTNGSTFSHPSLTPPTRPNLFDPQQQQISTIPSQSATTSPASAMVHGNQQPQQQQIQTQTQSLPLTATTSNGGTLNMESVSVSHNPSTNETKIAVNLPKSGIKAGETYELTTMPQGENSNALTLRIGMRVDGTTEIGINTEPSNAVASAVNSANGVTQPSATDTVDSNGSNEPNLMSLFQDPRVQIMGQAPPFKVEAHSTDDYLAPETSFADWAFDRCDGNLKNVGSTIDSLRNTAEWIHERYWVKDPWNGIGDTRLLSSQAATELAVQYSEGLERNMDETVLQRMMDHNVKKNILTDQEPSILPLERFTSENGFGTASSTSYNGQSLSDWLSDQVGPPAIGGTIYDNDQVGRAKRILNSTYTIGNQMCSNLDLDPDKTTMFGLPIGTLMTARLMETNQIVPDEAMSSYGHTILNKAAVTYDLLPEHERSLDQNSAASDEFTSTDTLPLTQASTNTNPTLSQNNTDFNDIARGLGQVWQAQQQSTNPTNAYGIPGTMRTGTRTNVPSAMKGGRLANGLNRGRNSIVFADQLGGSLTA